jgi:hypothetical protein
MMNFSLSSSIEVLFSSFVAVVNDDASDVVVVVVVVVVVMLNLCAKVT